jgi:Predicted membrane protein
MVNQKIEKNKYYNIIFMGDDGRARTYRLRRGLLRFLIYFPLLILLLSGGAIAGGVYFSKYHFDLVAEKNKQDKEISEMRLQLERLTNLEKLLSARPGTAPLAKYEEIGVTPSSDQPQEETSEPEAPVAEAEAPAQETADPDPEPIAGEEEEAPVQDHISFAELAPQADQTPPAEVAPELDFASMGNLSGNKSPLRVAGFSARPLGQQRVRIRYEITSTNRPGIKSISGLARHFAVFTDGQKAELPLPDNGENRFSLTRLRPMEATARLPQGFDTKDIKKIDVVIITDEYGTFHDLFDVTHWRSY